MDAFDADVLIYAAAAANPLGRPIYERISAPDADCVGSVLLLTEVLTKPVRDQDAETTATLTALLQRLDLLVLDRPTALLSVTLGAKYNLRAPDATHLATAVNAGADRFITNNRDDFPKSIAEVDIVYPSDLTR